MAPLSDIAVCVQLVDADSFPGSARPFFRVLAEAGHDCMPGARRMTIRGARHAATAQDPQALDRALAVFLATH